MNTGDSRIGTAFNKEFIPLCWFSFRFYRFIKWIGMFFHQRILSLSFSPTKLRLRGSYKAGEPVPLASEDGSSKLLWRASEWASDWSRDRAIVRSRDGKEMIITRAPEVHLTCWLARCAAIFETSHSKICPMLIYKKKWPLYKSLKLFQIQIMCWCFISTP